MTDFLAALIWGICVLIALTGWGRLIQRLIFPRARYQSPLAVDWLDAPTWGIAVISFIGGLLNLFSIAGRAELIACVAIGFLICVSELNRRRATRTTPVTLRTPVYANVLLAFVILLITLRFISSIVLSSPETPGVTLNPHDDMHSYLVSVARLLQTGTIGLDPFNARLMMNSLGAQHFLNALGIAVLPFDSIHLMDNGIGLVALCLSTAAFALRLGLRRAPAITLMLVPLAFEWIIANISSNLTSAATLLALASCALELPPPSAAWRDRLRWALPTSLLLAATCCLKSTMIPPVCLFIAMSTLFAALFTRHWRALGDVLLTAILAACFMLPWMLWQHQSSGTFLYPLLGRGNHVADSLALLDLTPAAQSQLLTNLPLPLSLLAIALIISSLRPIRRAIPPAMIAVTLSFLAAWTIIWPLLLCATGYPDLWRYILPITVPGVAIAIAFLWRSCDLIPSFRPGRFTASLAMLVFLACTAPQWLDLYFHQLPHNLYTSLTYESRPWSTQHAALQNLQQGIPAGQPIIAYLTTPALLDFNRNPIYVIDWPGEVSPPPPFPGMPVFDGGPAVADYLLAHHLRYVAYTYAGHANFYPPSYKQFLAPEYGRVINRQTRESLAFQDDLSQIAHSHVIIFNNGTDYVIDLSITHP